MTDLTPFSLRIFVVDGNPDGLRIVERSNWIGRAIMFPRPLFTSVRNRLEFQQTGVYLLLGPRTVGDQETLYVGEGDPIRPRLEEHFAKKDFWTRAVFFVAGPGHLNKAHVQYLEARLVSLAGAAKRSLLKNGNKPAEPTLSESDRADMNVFLNNILGMLPVLGIHAFEQSITPTEKASMPILTCQGRGVIAKGSDSPQGFIIQSGSFAAAEPTPSLAEYFSGAFELRNELLKSGVLVKEGKALRFTQDYPFSSPSFASAVVLGRNSNGRTDWKDSNGKTLKELQEAQVQNEH
jgi:hypothetical protein